MDGNREKNERKRQTECTERLLYLERFDSCSYIKIGQITKCPNHIVKYLDFESNFLTIWPHPCHPPITDLISKSEKFAAREILFVLMKSSE